MYVTIEMLIAAGFEFVPGAKTTLRKCMLACEMPYFNEHVVDEANIGPQDLALLIIDADRMVHFSVYEHGSNLSSVIRQSLYSESAMSIDSEDGIGLLRDAGLQTDKPAKPVESGGELLGFADFTLGQLVRWEWLSKGMGQQAIDHGLRPIGRVVDRSMLPNMASSLGIQLLDDSAWVIDLVFALSKGRTFSKVEE